MLNKLYMLPPCHLFLVFLMLSYLFIEKRREKTYTVDVLLLDHGICIDQKYTQ